MTSDYLQENENKEQSELVELEDALRKLKEETNQEGRESLSQQTDEQLQKLNELMGNLLVKQEGSLQEQLKYYPVLVELMRTLVKEVKYWKDDIYREAYTLSEEKRLLIELMYSVLAKIGRINQAQEVILDLAHAKPFFEQIGFGKLYAFLVQKAE